MPATIDVHPLLRPFAKRKLNIVGSEVPNFGPIHAVTVESLYRSEFAQKKLSYTGDLPNL